MEYIPINECKFRYIYQYFHYPFNFLHFEIHCLFQPGIMLQYVLKYVLPKKKIYILNNDKPPTPIYIFMYMLIYCT